MDLLGPQSEELMELYKDGEGPKYIKVDEYIYEYDYQEDMGPQGEEWERGKVWRRKWNRKWTPKQGVYTKEELIS